MIRRENKPAISRLPKYFNAKPRKTKYDGMCRAYIIALLTLKAKPRLTDEK